MMRNSQIVLSEKHPSLLEHVVRQAGYCAPVVVNQDSVLIDGYRRYQADPEIGVIQMNVHSLYDAAVTMNRNTRRWDDIDCFLWSRWAESLNLPHDSYPLELNSAPLELLRALASRKLQLGQAIRILSASPGTWSFFVDMLADRITLNVNETAAFIDMTFDLANRWKIKNFCHVFEQEILRMALNEAEVSSKHRGEVLLKAMRDLRYPLYQKKSEENSATWRELKLDQLQGNKGLFLNRGVLEITVRARSHEEMSEKVKELFESLDSPAWRKLWNE
jgi:hypothetical protein